MLAGTGGRAFPSSCGLLERVAAESEAIPMDVMLLKPLEDESMDAVEI